MRIRLPSRQPLGELVCAVSLLVLGVFIVIDGLQYPLTADGVVGPGLMPLAWGSGLAAASALLVVRSLRPVSREEAAQPSGSETLSLADFAEDDGEAAGKPATVAGILTLLALGVLLAPALGLIPMLGVLVFVCLFVFERQGLLAAALMAAGSMAAGWAVFGWLFEVPLPFGTVWQALGLG